MPVVDISVTKVDEAYIKVHADRGIQMELHDYFSFFVPGAQFSPKFRGKLWDGYIHLFSLHNQCIYHGLYRYLKRFADERKYSIEYDDAVILTNEFSLAEGVDFAKSLNVHSQSIKIEPRDFQVEAFVMGIRDKRRLVLSPTASGKSLIDYLIVRYLLQTSDKTRGLIIVPTTSLVEQLYSDFEDYSSANKWKVGDNIHKIYSGMEKVSDKRVIISTWQSIYKLPKEWFDNFDFVLGEECHLFKARSLTTIMTNLSNAKYRIGLTGTLDGTKTHKLVLEGLFGPVKRVVTTKELQERKQLAALTIKALILKHPDEVAENLRGVEYKDEISYINGCKSRNTFLRNLALSLNGNTLLLFRYVETHGQILYEAIKEKAGNRKVFFIYGSTETEVREETRKIVETETDSIIVASEGVFSTGINIRNLHNIIMASPSKSRIRILQSIGRALRTSASKETATLYDIVDDLRYKKHNNFTIKHFLERMKMYQDEQFTVKMYNIVLKG